MRSLLITTTAILCTSLAFVSVAQEEKTADNTLASDPGADQGNVNGISQSGEIRYVTDLIYTPVRTGPGGDYRILNKGLPSGTAVTYFGTTEDGIWAEVETRGGTKGYLRAQYLQSDLPRARQVNTLEAALEKSQARVNQLQAQLDASIDELASTSDEYGTAAEDLAATQQELAEIKRISANALQLDKLTAELTSKLEDASARNDLLSLENARLEERVASNQRLEGALAILVGIFVALIVPRLTVKRRRNDGWR